MGLGADAPGGLGGPGIGAVGAEGAAGAGRGAAAGGALGNEVVGPGAGIESAMAFADVTSMDWPHRRHFMRTFLPASFSSATWYFA